MPRPAPQRPRCRPGPWPIHVLVIEGLAFAQLVSLLTVAVGAVDGVIVDADASDVAKALSAWRAGPSSAQGGGVLGVVTSHGQ